MSITTKPVEYFDGKQKCVGYLAWDETYEDPKPGVIINHAWGGLDGFAEDKAIQMAALGYVGFALDNYGDGVLPETDDGKAAAMGALTENRKVLLKRLKAGYKAAAELPMIDENYMAAIGYCFGGLCTLDMVRGGLKLKAASSFHGLLEAPNYTTKKSKSKVLVAHGWDDPMAPPEHVVALGHELTKAGCDWQVHAYGQTTHAFTNPGAPGNDTLAYSADADRRSWQNTIDLLAEVFGLHGTDAAV